MHLTNSSSHYSWCHRCRVILGVILWWICLSMSAVFSLSLLLHSLSYCGKTVCIQSHKIMSVLWANPCGCVKTGNELPCAVKLLHPILIDPNKHRNYEMFKQLQECCFSVKSVTPTLYSIWGVAPDPQTGLPVLLMQLMDHSLTYFLELSETSLPYHMQVNINWH